MFFNFMEMFTLGICDQHINLLLLIFDSACEVFDDLIFVAEGLWELLYLLEDVLLSDGMVVSVFDGAVFVSAWGHLIKIINT